MSSGSLRVCCWNINGLTEEKTDENSAGPFFDKQDIIAVTESWCKEDMSIKGFKAFHFHRNQLNARALRGSGGISVYMLKKKFINIYLY